ncbi:MAG TPA: multiheme c-type cytochrome [Thermodesulfobacteriota bacterium]|nr:multiheme c-type cytochrome [Thermodesulfobacteriota bacterium]
MKRVFFLLVSLFVISALVLFADNGFAAEYKYVGAAKCKACHLAEFKACETTKHTKSMDSLKENEKKDPKCLVCHVTGYGKAAAEGSQLEGVQCEACHGPGSGYKSATIMNKVKWKANADAQKKLAEDAGMITTPSEEMCKTCHNKNSPTFKGFDYAKDLPKVKHKK